MVREGPGDRSEELFGLGNSRHRAVGVLMTLKNSEGLHSRAVRRMNADCRPMMYLEVEPTGHSSSYFH